METKKIKIIFILPSLKAGGAERVMSFVAQNLDTTKFEPVLLIIGFEKDSAYSHSKVRTVFLNKLKVSQSILNLSKVILKEKPQNYP